MRHRLSQTVSPFHRGCPVRPLFFWSAPPWRRKRAGFPLSGSMGRTGASPDLSPRLRRRGKPPHSRTRQGAECAGPDDSEPVFASPAADSAPSEKQSSRNPTPACSRSKGRRSPKNADELNLMDDSDSPFLPVRHGGSLKQRECVVGLSLLAMTVWPCCFVFIVAPRACSAAVQR